MLLCRLNDIRSRFEMSQFFKHHEVRSLHGCLVWGSGYSYSRLGFLFVEQLLFDFDLTSAVIWPPLVRLHHDQISGGGRFWRLSFRLGERLGRLQSMWDDLPISVQPIFVTPALCVVLAPRPPTPGSAPAQAFSGMSAHLIFCPLR